MCATASGVVATTSSRGDASPGAGVLSARCPPPRSSPESPSESACDAALCGGNTRRTVRMLNASGGGRRTRALGGLIRRRLDASSTDNSSPCTRMRAGLTRAKHGRGGGGRCDAMPAPCDHLSCRPLGWPPLCGATICATLARAAAHGRQPHARTSSAAPSALITSAATTSATNRSSATAPPTAVESAPVVAPPAAPSPS